jgi:hypothetical protein
MQFYQVQFRAVAFVLAEAILGKARAEVAHNRVARDFRDYAGGGNAQAEAIAIDNCGLRKRKGENGQAVDEHMVGLETQGVGGDAHRLVRRAQDIDRVDLDRIDNSDRPGDRAVPNQLVIDLFASLGEKLLGIVQPAVPEFFGEDDSGRYDGTGQRPPARFIDAGDRRDAKCAQSAFMPETTATVHGGKILKR